MPTPEAYFSGKIAVVTGAGSGIGRAIAQRLGHSGAIVHCADIDEAAAQATAAGMPQARAHRLDVTDPQALTALADQVYALQGRVDMLFNNAGIGHAAPVLDTELEDWRAVIAVNLMGVVNGIQAFLPRMLAQPGVSHVINTASGAGLFPHPRMLPYAASKHAVVGLSTSLAAELMDTRVRVTVLCPGIVKTAITQNSRMRGDNATNRPNAIAFYEKNGITPERVAEDVLRAVRQSRTFCLSPRFQVGLGWLIYRLSPTLAMRMMRAQIAKTMGNG